MSNREKFEYEAGKALNLPVSIIELARSGERYDHEFDSMSIMQPLNGWWHWWNAGREEAERYGRQADITIDNLEAKCAALAAENAALKQAFDKPQAYLSWHAIPPTWDDPLPCGEYLNVHDEAGHKNSDGTDCWPVFPKPEIETPAINAFLSDMRAQGVEMFATAMRRKGDDAFFDAIAEAQANAADVFATQLRQEAK